MNVRSSPRRTRRVGAAHVGFGAVKDSKNFQENTQWKKIFNWLSEAGYRKTKFLTLRSDNRTLN